MSDSEQLYSSSEQLFGAPHTVPGEQLYSSSEQLFGAPHAVPGEQLYSSSEQFFGAPRTVVLYSVRSPPLIRGERTAHCKRADQPGGRHLEPQPATTKGR